MAGSKPGERRGGRQKGTPNKATADIKALAQEHTEAAMKDASPTSPRCSTRPKDVAWGYLKHTPRQSPA
jgi:hypothetical protein